MRWWWAVPAALLGGVVGVAALAVHRHAVWFDGLPLPWGLALAVAAPAAAVVCVRAWQPVQLGFLLGWLMTVLAALTTGPGGDFLLMSDVLGWGFLGASLVIGLMLFLVAAIRRPATRRTDTGTVGR
jgi:hypothetical protein